jgi:hypothetical protein
MSDTTHSLKYRDEVIEIEYDEIVERRRCAGLLELKLPESKQQVSQSDLSTEQRQHFRSSLVGLALSGGGLRSAIFNMGLLQALTHKGLIRNVDYLCSVSGGGYTSGYLASLLNSAKKDSPNEKPDEHLSFGVNQAGKLTDGYQYYDIGQYLLANWKDLARRYVFSTLIMISLALSLLGTCATLIALLYRKLDQPDASALFDLSVYPPLARQLGLSDEFLKAFVPGIFGFTCYLLLYLVLIALRLIGRANSTLRWMKVAKTVLRRGATFALIATSISLVCSAAILLGNGTSAVQAFDDFADESSVSAQWSMWILALLGITMLPFLLFPLLARSAREDAGRGRKAILSGVLVLGCSVPPFWMLNWMGQENISGYATFRSADLHFEDVRNWTAFSSLLITLDARMAETQEIIGDKGAATSDRTAFDTINLFIPKVLEQKADLEILKAEILTGKKEFAEKVNNAYEYYRMPNVLQRWKYTASYPLRNNFLTSFLPWYFPTSEMKEYLNHRSLLRGYADELIKTFNSDILPQEKFTHVLLSNLERRIDASGNDSQKQTGSPIGADKEMLTVASLPASEQVSNFYHLLKPNSQAALADIISQSQVKTNLNLLTEEILWFCQRPSLSSVYSNFAGGEGYTPGKYTQGIDTSKLAMLNRQLLDILYPRTFKDVRMVSSSVVAQEDEYSRLRWLALWLSILTTIALFADFNRLSAFYFYYRQQLKEHFLNLRGRDTSDLHLSDIRNCKSGYPYPLFLCSLHLFGNVKSNRFAFSGQQKSSVESNNKDKYHPFSRPTRNHEFLLSPFFIGSDCCGYSETAKAYPQMKVVDAVALSGAAFTPFMFKNDVLRIILAFLNVRLGQWVYRPTGESKNNRGDEKTWPSVKTWKIFREYFLATFSSNKTNESSNYDEKWRLGLVADGGFEEFLGLSQLLLRRCRLIIVSDAGCNNGRYEFGVLADVLRKMRMEFGMEFLDLDHDTTLDLEKLRRNPTTRRQFINHLCFRVRYPENYPINPEGPREAFVVYAQMSITGKESVDIDQFRNANPTFPDEPIANQFFSEDQVESYRCLGYYVGQTISQTLPWAYDDARSFHPHESKFKEDYFDTECLVEAFRESYITYRWSEMVQLQPQPSAINMGDIKALRQIQHDCENQIHIHLSRFDQRLRSLSFLQKVLSIDTQHEARMLPLLNSGAFTSTQIIDIALGVYYRFTGGRYSPVDRIFIPGGRKNLVDVAVWLKNCLEDLPDDVTKEANNLKLVDIDPNEKLLDLYATIWSTFARLLMDDVFLEKSAEPEIVGLITTVLLHMHNMRVSELLEGERFEPGLDEIPSLKINDMPAFASRISRFTANREFYKIKSAIVSLPPRLRREPPAPADPTEPAGLGPSDNEGPYSPLSMMFDE